MADLRSSTSIGGNLAWHSGNLKLDTQGNTVRYAGYKLYSEFDKPHPSTDLAVAAVKLAGDTMTGDLILPTLTANTSLILANTSSSSAPLTVTRTSQVGIFLNDTTAPRYLGTSAGDLYFGSNLNHAVNALVITSSNYINNLDPRYARKAITETISGSWTFTGVSNFTGNTTVGKGLYFGGFSAYLYAANADDIYMSTGTNTLGIDSGVPVFNGARLTRVNQAETITSGWTFSAIPSTAVAPTTANHLVNKTYADTKLPLAGGTLTGELISKSISIGENSVAVIKNPAGATFSGGASLTGYLKITLPNSWTDTMMRMIIRVYEYDSNKSFDLHVGGYAYAVTGTWSNNPFAYIISSSGGANYPVRLGHDGTKCCIYVGESNTNWAYVKAHVAEVQLTHSNNGVSNWNTGWVIGTTTTLGTITATFTNVVVGRYIDGNAVLSTGNYTSTLDSRYVNKTGDSMSGNLTAPTFIGALSGNATTATTLQTARTINGVSFNGSANITVADSTKLPLTGGALTGVTSITTGGSVQDGTTATYTEGLTIVGGNQRLVMDASSTSNGGAYLQVRHQNATYPTNYYTLALNPLGGAVTVNGNAVYHAGNNNIGTGATNYAAGNHTHSYLPLTGGTLTGNLTAPTFVGALSGNATTATNAVGILSTGAVVTLQTSAVGGYFNFTSSGASIAAGVRVGSIIATSSYSNAPPPVGQITATQFNGTLNGNATTATTLQTARTLTIGSTGKSFNGSANVSWTLAEIGAAASSHTHSYLPLTGGTLTGNLTIRMDSASSNAQQIINASSGWTWTLMTSGTTGTTGAGTVHLAFNNTAQSIAPANSYHIRVGGADTQLAVHGGGVVVTALTSNGTVTAPTFSGALSGNATTATTLQTARTLTIGSTGKSFNGSANVSWSLAEIGAAASSHTHSYLPLTGGTLSGAILLSNGSAASPSYAFSGDTNTGLYWYAADQLGFATGGSNRAILNSTGFSVTGSISATGNISGYSDIRLKTNIVEIQDALQKVSEVKGVIYTEIATNRQRTGVIAQEIQKVLPEAVIEDEKGFLSVDYGNIVGLLIQAINELNAEVKELKKPWYKRLFRYK